VTPLRRHPSRMELEAWFDGESGDGLGWHISGCPRCLAHVERLSKVRAAVTATTMPARGTAGAGARTVMDDRPAPVPAAAGAAGAEPGGTLGARAGVAARRRPLVAAAGAAIVTVGALAGLEEGPLHGALFVDSPGHAPSAAYRDTSEASAVPGATTVLGLPWPTSAAPGSARFRAVVPGVSSYRAMVSFAATELAVAVARAAGSVTPAAVAGGTWRSDLFDYTGTANAGAQSVVTSPVGWVATS